MGAKDYKYSAQNTHIEKLAINLIPEPQTTCPSLTS